MKAGGNSRGSARIATNAGDPVRDALLNSMPLSILLDGVIFGLQRQGGISVYCRELLQRMKRDGLQAVLTLDGALMQEPPLSGGALATLMRPARSLERYRRCRIPAAPTPTLFHSSYYRRPSDRSLPTVVTVYDFTYERFVSGPRRWVHSAQKRAAIREAQAIICISEATRDDLQEFVGVRPDQKTYVIHLGASDVFHPLGQPPRKAPFVLFVGQRAGYKNFQIVLKAMAHLPDLELRCVGGGALHASELETVPTGVRNRVRHVGSIADHELNRLYNEAMCLVYPSRYEGFGIPVIEAMRAGCPVVSVRCNAVLEVGLDALTVSADDEQSLACSIEKLSDAHYRAEKVHRGLAVAARYGWEQCYGATMQVYRQLST